MQRSEGLATRENGGVMAIWLRVTNDSSRRALVYVRDIYLHTETIRLSSVR